MVDSKPDAADPKQTLLTREKIIYSIGSTYKDVRHGNRLSGLRLSKKAD